MSLTSLPNTTHEQCVVVIVSISVAIEVQNPLVELDKVSGTMILFNPYRNWANKEWRGSDGREYEEMERKRESRVTRIYISLLASHMNILWQQSIKLNLYQEMLHLR